MFNKKIMGQAIMISHHGTQDKFLLCDICLSNFQSKNKCQIFYHRCMGQRWDHCSQSMYASRIQVDLRGEQNVCALCNCGSVQKHSGHDVNPVLPEKSTFNITFSFPLGNSRFSPPLLFFLKTKTTVATSERLYQYVQSLPLLTQGLRYPITPDQK